MSSSDKNRQPLTTIDISANTIPATYGQRDGVETAVRKAIGNRPGEWEVWLEEPHDASFYRVKIRGPRGFRREWTFDGPDEQDTTLIELAIKRDIGQVTN
jgi:hypothetical protein